VWYNKQAEIFGGKHPDIKVDVEPRTGGGRLQFLEKVNAISQGCRVRYRSKALQEWIGFVPHVKISTGSGAVTVEDAFRSWSIIRQVLSQVLARKVERGDLDEQTAFRIATALLRDNACRIYRLPPGIAGGQ